MTKLSELKQQFTDLTGYAASSIGVNEYFESLAIMKQEVLGTQTLSKTTTWQLLLDYVVRVNKRKQEETKLQEERLEKNDTSPESDSQSSPPESDLEVDNPAVAVISLDEKEQKHDRVMSRQSDLLSTIEGVTIEPAPPLKKGRKIAPRIKSYAVNGHESSDFLFNSATYKLQVIGNQVALLRYANNYWRVNSMLGKVVELRYEKDYWYVLANGTPLARQLANELYHNPSTGRAELAKQFGVAFKTFDIVNGLVEYVQPNNYDDEWQRKIVTLKRVLKAKTDYQFYPNDQVYQKSKLHATAIEKTEQWLRYLSTNELTGVPVKYKFRKKRRSGTYKYVPIVEEVVNVHKTLLMLSEGRRGKKDLGYYLVKATGDQLTDEEMKDMAHQIAITGKRGNKGYLCAFTWFGCTTSEDVIWHVLQYCNKTLPTLAFIDANGKRIEWSQSKQILQAWLLEAKQQLPDYVRSMFMKDTIKQVVEWLKVKVNENNLSYEYRFKVTALLNKCPLHLIDHYGYVKVSDFLSLMQ